MLAAIDSLLKENQSELLEDRRCVDRRPFVRPATIRAGRDHELVAFAFSRDVTPIGIGLISQVAWKERCVATIEIHSTKQHEGFSFIAEVRWTRAYGERWYYTGWRFVDE